MQLINTWSDLTQLELPESVKVALMEHLIKPFHTEAYTKTYWLENLIQLAILEPNEILGDTVPEYTEPLSDGYCIQLVITSDAGGGIYSVLPPKE